MWGDDLVWYKILLIVDFWVVVLVESLFLWDEVVELILVWFVFDEDLFDEELESVDWECFNILLERLDVMFLLLWELLFFLFFDDVLFVEVFLGW